MRLSQRAENIVLPLAAIVLALIIGAVLIWLDGANPFEAYKSLLEGALGSRDAVARTLEKATPLIFTGLAVIVGMKAGLFNIGAQGQLLLGAVFAAWIGYRLDMPTVFHVPLALIVGGLFGMLPAALAGVLKAYRGAHEVITTIMLNAILISLTEWMVGSRGPFHDPDGGAISRTPVVRSTAEIPRIADLPVGFFLGVVVAIVIWWFAGRTTIGFKVATVGQNKNAAEYGGISAARITVLAMCISGFLAGLGGSIETLGVVRALRVGPQRRPRLRRHHRRPAGPDQPHPGHPVRAAAGDDAGRPDQDGLRHQGGPGDHRRDPGHHPPARVRPDRRPLDPAPAQAHGRDGRRPAHVGVGGLMSPRTRTVVFSLLPVVVVVGAAFAFYYLNSEVKTGAVLNSTFRQSTPLVLAAMCGLLGERTGVVNIGIEGQLLMSAFTGFYTAAATGNIWVGALAGVVSGMVLGLFLALCAVTWKIDQIIAGTVINIFVAGITSFLYTQGKRSPGGWTSSRSLCCRGSR